MNINSAKQFELDLPEWFGGNMSAFWDALTGIIEVPAVIIFHKQIRNEDLTNAIRSKKAQHSFAPYLTQKCPAASSSRTASWSAQ